MLNRSDRLTWNFKLIPIRVKEKIRMARLNPVKNLGRPATQDRTRTLTC